MKNKTGEPIKNWEIAGSFWEIAGKGWEEFMISQQIPESSQKIPVNGLDTMHIIPMQ